MKTSTGMLLVLGFAAMPAGAASSADAAPLAIRSEAGVAVSVESGTGIYTVAYAPAGWVFAGALGSRASAARIGHGADAIGRYDAITFRCADKAPLSGSIRVYRERPAVLFEIRCEQPADAGEPVFPRFDRIPDGLHPFSYANRNFAPPRFSLEQTSTPWLLFADDGSAAVLSPAANFTVARMIGDGRTEIACGLDPELTRLPAGFAHRSLLAFGRGINAAWDSWGDALRRLAGRRPVANDADIGLRCLGYWTDNGAYYYYNYDRRLGYEETLVNLARHYRALRIPIRYLQLDSWWYYKSFTGPDGRKGGPKDPSLPDEPWNRYGGLMRYEPPPGLFPDGLAGFQRQVGLPLITHNRWVDPESPYHRKYAFVGIAGADAAWWRLIMDTISKAGVVCYEQDWLDRIERYSPQLKGNPAAWDGFLGGMARAAARDGLSIQYCMPEPRHFLQGVAYGNLTTIRTSDDRFQRDRWDDFLYVSRLACSVGIRPWTDVFMSTEKANLLVATLSGGMVGIGDEIGRENRSNLLRASRADGVLVKPDGWLVPIGSVYLGDALGRHEPMIAWNHTDHAAQRTAYVLAYNRQPRKCPASFKPATFGLGGAVLIYDARTEAVTRLPGTATFDFDLPEGAYAYFEIVPVNPSGLSFLGDSGKFVSNGQKRIAAIERDGNGIRVTVAYGAGENSVHLFGFAPAAPDVRAIRGAVSRVTFDRAAGGRYEFDVDGSAELSREEPGGDPIRRAVVEIEPAPAQRRSP